MFSLRYQLLGLNLLCLLAQNRLAEFHTELERLPANEIDNNVYIRHPVSLEQNIMEGSYNKDLLAKGNVPAESYNFFIDILMDTVRNEIASCLDKVIKSRLKFAHNDTVFAALQGNQVVGEQVEVQADNQEEEGGVHSLELARKIEQIVLSVFMIFSEINKSNIKKGKVQFQTQFRE